MFPLRDDNPRLGTPWVTLGLIAANVIVWVLVEGLGFHKAVAHSMCEFGVIPAELLQRVEPGTIFQLTPDTACMIGPDPNWHTLLTSMFLHGGWFHLISNLWFLFVFGRSVEEGMGPLRYMAFYLTTGVTAALLHIAMDPSTQSPAVGASGAIGGVMGAYLMLYPKVNVHLWVFVTRIIVPAYSMMAFWLFVQIVMLYAPATQPIAMAFWLHVGGFVAGVALSLVFRNKSLVERHAYHGWN